MKKSLSLFSANLLFAFTLLLVALVGSTIQSVSLSWGLIATEVLLIALPALLFLRSRGVPLRQGLRLNRLPVLTGILCVGLGVAMYLFGMLIEGVMAQVTGLQSVSIQSSLLPKTGADMLVYFAALAIFAPLCEEILFRGAVQGAYERQKSARFAITITALMFAFYHMRLSGLPALLPVAFVLSYVVWRTGSLFAGMLIHFGNNGASALNNILYFRDGQGLPFLTPGSALVGLAVALILLVVITRLHSHSQAEAGLEPGTAPKRRPWLATYWPLIFAGGIYIAVAGLTVAALIPRPAPAAQIEYGLPILHPTVASHYEITNKGGQTVGALDCTLIPQGSTIGLACTRTIHAYELQTGNSFYKDGSHTDTLNAAWDATSMELVTFSYERKSDDGSAFQSTLKDGKLVTAGPGGVQTADLPQHALVEFEWAWHAALLKANSGKAYSVPFVLTLAQDANQKVPGPAVRTEVLQAGDDETLTLPGGSLTARRLTLGPYTAWYARQDALAGLPRPAKFDDGMVIYILSSQ